MISKKYFYFYFFLCLFMAQAALVHAWRIKDIFASSAPNIDWKAKMVEAIENGDVRTVKEIVVKPDFDVNAYLCGTGCFGTPLALAVRFGQIEVVEFLLSLSHVDVSGEPEKHFYNWDNYLDGFTVRWHTPLMALAHLWNADPKVAEKILPMLLAAPNIDVNRICQQSRASLCDSWTALHFAAFWQHIPMIKALLQIPGVMTAHYTWSGGHNYALFFDTPLMLALEKGKLEAARVLLAYEDANGDSIGRALNYAGALRIAEAKGYTEIAEYIKSRI